MNVRGVTVPAFLYGTAWKEEATEALVVAALEAGFRGIDTANQRKHYFEEGVGRALKRSGLPRESLFLQTKFTFRGGQDHRLPYDPKAAVATQVAQSFEKSLEHLGVDRLDSLVLHGPTRRYGLGPEDWEAWKAMEALAQAGRTRLLGVSNVTAEQVQLLATSATVKPAFVQNRCYAELGWDHEVRVVCAQHGIVYQGFSLLTANPQVLRSAEVRKAAGQLEKTPEQLVFRYALDLGMLPLTGTSDSVHMRQDLAAEMITLDDEVREVISSASAR